ncbi:helix-hairpin-helix domain-containing protein [Streptococcus sp. sy010]|uniref:helix-hairpin-helix domain-containing protein n=1 Tax=Streptococcus sp. sy010 TaxID=2600148 RepID=UPI0011B5A941|nr:helix-hairpin-helix domain-containing protein [Streptococcus sp. sy010]TWT16589.1 ComEA family DNA-binding protein [Streptococcus sp. sy010]
MDHILTEIKNKKFLLVGLGGVIFLFLTYFSFFQPTKEQDDLLLTSSSNQVVEQREVLTSDRSLSSESEQDVLVVDIKGEVKKEGVYQLPAGSRVNDAIKAAGGLTELADKKSVNLAQKLTDASVIYVASQGENISVVTPQIKTDEESQLASSKVNINQASLSDLQTISGIGAKRAQDIIDYRESNGSFQTVDDLKKVSGIGEKTFEKLRELISVD